MKTYIKGIGIDLTGLSVAQSQEAKSRLLAVNMQLSVLDIAVNALNILLHADLIQFSEEAFSEGLRLIFEQPNVVAPAFPLAQDDFTYDVLDNVLADLRAKGLPVMPQAWEEDEGGEVEPVDPVSWPDDPQAATIRNILGPHWAALRVVPTVPEIEDWIRRRAGHVEGGQFTAAINSMLRADPKNAAAERHNPRPWEGEDPTMCLDTLTWGELRAWLEPRVYQHRHRGIEMDLSGLGATRSARIITLLGLTLPAPQGDRDVANPS